MKKLFIFFVMAMLLASNAYAVVTATLTTQTSFNIANQRASIGYMTLSGTYVTGGVALAPSKFGLSEIKTLMIFPYASGYHGSTKGVFYSWVSTTDRLMIYDATSTITPTFTATAITADEFTMKDSDAASSEKLVALVSFDGTTGWFECLSAGGAEFFASDSATAGMIVDSTIAGLSVALINADTLYFDDDFVVEDRRLLYSGNVIKSTNDIYVPYGESGQCIVVKYASNAGALGTPVYFNHDAAAVDERLLSTTAGDADSNFDGDDTQYAGISNKPSGTISAIGDGGGSEMDNGILATATLWYLVIGN